MESDKVKMLQIFKLLVVLLSICAISSSGQPEVLFLIASQSTSYHRRLSDSLRMDIAKQYDRLTNADYAINVVQLPSAMFGGEDWPPLRAMAALRRDGVNVVHANTTWLVWCEESTHIDVEALLQQLGRRNHTEALYLGHALHDREATIIHHFAFFEDPKWFPYPLLRAGVVFTRTLYDRLSALRLNDVQHTPARPTQFTIDVAHELALLIYDNIRAPAAAAAAATAAAPKITDKLKTKDKSNKIHSNKSINNANGTNGNVRNNVAIIDSGSDSGSGSGGVNVNDNDDYASNGEMIRMQAVQRPATTTTTTTTTATTTATMTPSSTSTVGVRKILLQHAPFICPQAEPGNNNNNNNNKKKQHCAMHAKPMDLTTCVPIQRACIYFAIKTCRQFHKERIPLLESTWTPFTVHKKFYSDVTDTGIPTTSTGVPNINGGHCAKTLAIFKLALKDIEQTNQQNAAAVHHYASGAATTTSAIQWLFLADDDTLLSVARLTAFLGCFNASTAIYLGERYGYRMHASDGFSYITGGGGIVLSMPALRQVVRHCTCPSASAPDDMILGACMQSLAINAIHSSRFHQARSMDYAPELLRLETPITFHKFWQLDPLMEYARWFAAADRQMLQAEQLRKQQQMTTFSNASQQHCRAIEDDRLAARCCSAQLPMRHMFAHHAQQRIDEKQPERSHIEL